MERYDVVVVGGGVLGTALSYWLSRLYEGRIAVMEMEGEVACHTSGRNTGVIHRPFYLDPEKREIFARSAQISYGLWKAYAREKGLPWREIGTVEVATSEKQLKHLEKYKAWSLLNGMRDDEVDLLGPQQVRALEPHVRCLGAIHCKTDSSVNYGLFTRALRKDAEANGVRFLLGHELRGARAEATRLSLRSAQGLSLESGFLVNCSGGNAVDIAHLLSVGTEYTDLHFRGEYWEVAPEKVALASRNIYTVPKHPDIPFLDPHWIVREDGRREIGPNAVLVAGCQTYEGPFSSLSQLCAKVLERPVRNKLKLFVNPDFLRLASEEWVSSVSKSAMAQRVRKFLPELEPKDLFRKGTAGIRSSVIGPQGNFVKEAIEIFGPLSFHVLNYNSPGATGAPAYAVALLKKLEGNGALSGLKKRHSIRGGGWDFGPVAEALGR